MAYIPSECTEQQYYNAVYGIGPEHRLYIKVGDTELAEPDDFCERLEWNNKLLANGSKTFSLDNFVSKEIDLTLRNFVIEDLDSEIEIKLGTYVKEIDDFVYVPLGIYLIQGNPTTDKGKTVYKLRDRSVLFDFNYNAKPLIDESTNETAEGSKYVTKLEILQDICLQAGVDYVGSTTFIGHDDILGIYNNTISGRLYISYIAEQAGCIAYIDRNGNLNFIKINNNLKVQQMPFNLVQEYTLENSFNISKTIYESGQLYWEKGTDLHDKLFINGANPYIANQSQVDRIQDSVEGFTIDGLSTGSMVGNPAIDSFDFIEFYDDENDVVIRTLGQNSFTYNGIFRQSFDTKIELGAKNTNTSVRSEATYRKYVKSEIDNVNATITTTIGLIDENKSQITQMEQTVDGITTKIEEIDEIEERVSTVEQTTDGIEFKINKIGGQNLIINSVGQYGTEYWENPHDIVNALDEHYNDVYNNSNSKSGWRFMKERLHKQIINAPQGTYTISAKFKKLLENAEVLFNVNGLPYNIENADGYELNEWVYIEYTFNLTSAGIELRFTTDSDNSCLTTDLMLNGENIALTWQPANGESILGNTRIGINGVEVGDKSKENTSLTDTGLRMYYGTTEVGRSTATGMKANKYEGSSFDIGNVTLRDMENINQTWLTRR